MYSRTVKKKNSTLSFPLVFLQIILRKFHHLFTLAFSIHDFILKIFRIALISIRVLSLGTDLTTFIISSSLTSTGSRQKLSCSVGSTSAPALVTQSCRLTAGNVILVSGSLSRRRCNRCTSCGDVSGSTGHCTGCVRICSCTASTVSAVYGNRPAHTSSARPLYVFVDGSSTSGAVNAGVPALELNKSSLPSNSLQTPRSAIFTRPFASINKFDVNKFNKLYKNIYPNKDDLHLDLLKLLLVSLRSDDQVFSTKLFPCILCLMDWPLYWFQESVSADRTGGDRLRLLLRYIAAAECRRLQRQKQQLMASQATSMESRPLTLSHRLLENTIRKENRIEKIWTLSLRALAQRYVSDNET
ncbi:hypothetical protein AGLY_001968, partial [Aphis glycines]